ncbi:MAG TPA: YceI family protein [Acidimicrobiales bacterium]|nr:YceI family protein [Acidimicrobiales bacterium]
MRAGMKWIVGGVVALAVLVSAGTYVYVHYVEGPAPARLTLDSSTSSTMAGGATVASSADPSGVSGAWRPTSDSTVGYRVKEVLFGQDNTAVGRTNKVTGSMTIDGTTVKTVDLTVDMSSVASDQARRDNQFKGRIMDTSTYPTSTFKLTQPINLSNVADGSTVSANAVGQLTLRGTTETVTIPIKAKRNGSKIEVNGILPVTFADWKIPSPSFGPVTTEDHGELELLVVFERAG